MCAALIKIAHSAHVQIRVAGRAFVSAGQRNQPCIFMAFPANHKYSVSFFRIFYYNEDMFTQNKCLVHHCQHNALSAFDEDGNITEEKNYCLDHIPNPGMVKENICKYIHEHEKIIGLNACGIFFSDMDFSNKKFFGCDFTGCSFMNVRADNITARLCFFDFSSFTDCSFTNSSIIFTSFSASTFAHSLLTSSNLIQCNFNAIQAYQSSFDGTDLFSSRFIKSLLFDTSFRNCNLKKTILYDTKRMNVSFKMSNTREAVFSRSGDNTDDAQFGNSIVDGGA